MQLILQLNPPVAYVDEPADTLDLLVSQLWSAVASRPSRQPDTRRRPPQETIIAWAPGRIALRCLHCNGSSIVVSKAELCACDYCGAAGFIGIDPNLPTTAMRGTTAKVAVLAARNAVGLPLWNRLDSTGISDDEERAIRRTQAKEDADSRSDDCANWDL